MAQLVARLVRNEKVGGSNPPSSTAGRHPVRMSVFCMPGRVGAVPCCRVACGAAGVPDAPLCCFVGPGRCVCRWARPAREIATREPDGSEWSISRPALALPPPTGTAAGLPVPPAPSAPAAPCVLMVLRVVSKPGHAPLAGHRHRGRASRFGDFLKPGGASCLCVALALPPPPTGAASGLVGSAAPLIGRSWLVHG